VKLFQNILSIILVTAFFNVVIAKSAHEYLEHSHEHSSDSQEGMCGDEGLNHFHQHEFAHLDFICDFNFSASLFSGAFLDFNKIIRYQENKIKIQFLWLAKNLCANSISLRGPPVSSPLFK